MQRRDASAGRRRSSRRGFPGPSFGGSALPRQVLVGGADRRVGADEAVRDLVRGLGSGLTGEGPCLDSHPPPIRLSGPVAFVGRMPLTKASRRRKEAERRERDVVREALRRRKESPLDSLRALSAHNEALRRLHRARR